MGFFADFMPFYPKEAHRGSLRKLSKADVERALDVEMHANPDLETRRADTGELVLRVRRQLHPAERFFGRMLGVKHHRQMVLDQYGEFLLEEATGAEVRLHQVAEKMATTFDLDIDKARIGIIHMVKELMLRDFVFLVRHDEPPGTPPEDHSGAF